MSKLLFLVSIVLFICAACAENFFGWTALGMVTLGFACVTGKYVDGKIVERL